MNAIKISVVIDNEFVLRSYLESAVLDGLSKEFDVELVLIDQKLGLGAPKHILLSKTVYLQFLQTIMSVLYWFKKQDKSNAFRIRLLSLLHSRRYFYSSRKVSFRIPSVPVIAGFLLGSLGITVPRFLVFSLCRPFTSHFTTTCSNLIIYVTTGGASSNSDTLSLIGKKLGVPTLVLVENWDNLTSKAVFNFKPDFLGVWGIQDKAAAIELHGFAPDRVFQIGSPRVSKLIKSHCYNSVPPRNILFAGGSTDFPFEFEWLTLTISLASKLQHSLIYVPHPANYATLSQYEAKEIEEVFSAIPNQILQLIKLKNGKSLPALDFYTPIFQSASITISPYSTMLLESLLIGIPTVGIDFKESTKESEGWASQSFEHFQQLESFEHYTRVTERAQLEQVVSQLVRTQPAITNSSTPGTNFVGTRNIFYDVSSTFEEKLISTVRMASALRH
jgi:hypothetical protein